VQESFEDITAVILAGGQGTRLQSEVSDRSKVVAEVGDKPFITRIFDQLIAVGVRKAILCTGYKAEGVEALLGTHYKELILEYSPESEPLGTGGAIRNALPKMDTETLLVMNGDSYFSGNLLKLLDFHNMNRACTSIMLCFIENVVSYGQVKVSANHLVEAFQEKQGIAQPGWVNAGLYLLKKDWVKSIPTGRKVSLEAELFPSWIGKQLLGYSAEGTLLDIGTPERYHRAEQYFATLDK
jgi:D-glycero-alpha-D-manno-heptose 1-phosphate guanylyltransferase